MHIRAKFVWLKRAKARYSIRTLKCKKTLHCTSAHSRLRTTLYTLNSHSRTKRSLLSDSEPGIWRGISRKPNCHTIEREYNIPHHRILQNLVTNCLFKFSGLALCICSQALSADYYSLSFFLTHVRAAICHNCYSSTLYLRLDDIYTDT